MTLYLHAEAAAVGLQGYGQLAPHYRRSHDQHSGAESEHGPAAKSFGNGQCSTPGN